MRFYNCLMVSHSNGLPIRCKSTEEGSELEPLTIMPLGVLDVPLGVLDVPLGVLDVPLGVLDVPLGIPIDRSKSLARYRMINPAKSAGSFL